MTNVRPHNLSNLSYSIATIIINNHMLSSESTLTAGSSRLGVYIGVVSLSAIGIFGAVRYFKIWQQTIRTHKHDAEVRRRQEEEIRSLRCSLSEHRAEMEDEKKASASLKEEVGRLEKKARDAEVDMDASRRQNQTLTNKIKALTTQNKQLEVDSQKMATELGQVKDLLDSRSRALRAAQTFLTKADQIAGADVIKLVEQLNAEILQTAANMAEAFAIEEKKINSEGKEQESDDARLATARTEEIIGSRLTELLRTSEHHEDPILVQTAFQTGMAAYAHWMISSWCFESPEDEHMLSEIYARVREAGKYADFLKLKWQLRNSFHRRTSSFGSMETVDKDASPTYASTRTRPAPGSSRSIGKYPRRCRIQRRASEFTSANHVTFLKPDWDRHEVRQRLEQNGWRGRHVLRSRSPLHPSRYTLSPWQYVGRSWGIT